MHYDIHNATMYYYILIIYGTFEQNKVNECAVCLFDLDHNLNNISLIACGHCFHTECIEKWEELKKITNRLRKIDKSKCPLCRVQYI